MSIERNRYESTAEPRRLSSRPEDRTSFVLSSIASRGRGSKSTVRAIDT